MCLGSEKPVGGGSKLEVREPGNDNSRDLCSSGPQGSSVGGPRAALGRRGRLLDGGDVCAELTDEQTLAGHASGHAVGCRETKQRGLQGERHTGLCLGWLAPRGKREPKEIAAGEPEVSGGV